MNCISGGFDRFAVNISNYKNCRSPVEITVIAGN